ncbi:MAG: hypothetical protein OEL83_11150 [Desulforhopalus sp.]|nr:hypothetical protein [Desulforhopalus sp.]
MMTNEKKYRLGEFILTEHGGVFLTWITHMVFGCQRSGKCLILGNILIVFPWESEEPGYLKLEFHMNQMRLPVWNSTKYYCVAPNLRQVSVDRSVTKHLVEQISANKIKSETVNITGPSVFRLGRRKISVDENGVISWQAISELSKIIGGTCNIESGVLCLGPKEIEFLDEGQSRLFYTSLKVLQKWDKTLLWGHQESLLICKESEHRNSNIINWNSEHTKACLSDYFPFLSSP